MIEQGIHDLPIEDYHRDPVFQSAGVPSLSSSGIRTLLSETPAHFAARHPGLTSWPDHAEVPTKEQDLGTIVHKIVLGKGSEIALIDGFDDWRKKEAQELRAAARAMGQIPVLHHTFEEAHVIAFHATEALKARFGTWPLGDSEVTAIWKRGDVWARSLMDNFSYRAATIVDLKGTGKGLSDRDLQKKAEQEWAIQAAHYLNGVTTIFPELAGLAQFLFCVVEFEPPYSTRIFPLAKPWLELAAQRIDIAAERFAACIAKGEWPKYPDDATPLPMPEYVRATWSLQVEMVGAE